MCTTRNIVGVLTIAALAFAAGRTDLLTDSIALAQSQQPPKEKDAVNLPAPPAGGEMDARMQAMLKASTPGRNHDYLEPSIGKFEGFVRFRMSDGGEWLESKGTIERQWTLNKHYVLETVHAASAKGGAFEGVGYMGFNITDGQYEVAWMDTDSTAILFELGTYDPDKKVMSTRGQQRDPLTGRLIQSRNTWDMTNPDRHVYAGYTVGEDGKEFKSFEGVFERVKK